MLKHRLAVLALSLALATGAQAASLTPPNLVAASSLNNPDLLLVWPYAAGGPLEAMSWSAFKLQMAGGLSSTFLTQANNLSDLGNATIARTNLGLAIGTSGNVVCLLNTACTYGSTLTAPAHVANGTGGAGYVELDSQSSIPSPPGSLNLRVYSDANGRFAWVGSGGFKAALDATGITSGRVYTLPDTTGAVCVQGANCGTTVSGAIKGNGSGTYSQAACADLSNGGNGGCAAKVVTGSLSPTLVYMTPGTSSFSYSIQSGYWACTNGIVQGWGFVRFTPTNGTASGGLTWNNPPYDAAAGGQLVIGPPVILVNGWASLATQSYIIQTYSNSQFQFISYSGTTSANLTPTQATNGTSKDIGFSFSYAVTGGVC